MKAIFYHLKRLKKCNRLLSLKKEQQGLGKSIHDFLYGSS